MTKETKTQPLPAGLVASQGHLTVEATYQDPVTKALYVHADLEQRSLPWEEEAHLSPMATDEKFGDVESFVAYITRYGSAPTTHLTWNRYGLKATLDYANDDTSEPGRCQWSAYLPFVASLPWQAWSGFANGQSHGQKNAVERLEDLASDIVSPSPTDLMGLLRNLRATVNARADAELRPDGTTKVAFVRDTKVQTPESIDLPASFTIAIPVLKGHVGPEGRTVLYRLDVRLRVSVDDQARLTLRFSIPNADRTLEDVYADRVEAAKGLLGETFDLLRAAD